MRRVDYNAVLYGLLHDIGKPMLRYRMRVEKGLEEYSEEIMEYLKNAKDHEEISDTILKEVLGLSPESYTRHKKKILEADEITSAERGLEAEYFKLRNIWDGVELDLSRRLGVAYSHHESPMLSPLWLLLKTNYKNLLGPCAKSSFNADDVWGNISDSLKSLMKSISSGDTERISEELAEILKVLISEPVWYPAVLLNEKTLTEIKASNYLDASKEISYYSIVKYLIDTLKTLREAYDLNHGVLNHRVRGLINTLLEALKYSLLTVPSAVYLALAPDISLYSHSKLVSAYIAALTSDSKAFRLMILDARGIQDFVSAPVKAKAASRVIRGRSLITELVTNSLANYVLELYGGLPNTNIISSEGGSLVLVVPQTSEEDKLVKALEEVIRSTYERLKGLWFTIAYSRPFTIRDARYFSALISDKGGAGFMSVLESLENELATKKSQDNARMRFEIEEDRILGFDAITQEPVTAGEVSTGFYGLKISEDNLDYANKIVGPNKLEPGEVISEATHLSLVAGTCSRNMIYLVSTHIYEVEENVLRPSPTLVNKLTEELITELSHESKTSRELQKYRLIYDLEETINDSNYKLTVGLLPMPSLGSLHVVVSVRDAISGDYVSISSKLIKKVLMKIHETLTKVRSGIEDRVLVRVDLKVVNAGSEFIKALTPENLQDYVSNFLKKDIDVSLGVFHTGAYHPYHLVISKERPEGEEIPGLILADLDEYPLIGLAKIDADELGEIKKLMSFSPSRLVTFSDLLTVLLSIKTHILSLRHSEEYMKSGLTGRGPIMLYVGGDDVAFYGHWVDVIRILYEVYDKVLKTMYPLSFSSAVVVEASNYPLLELYSRVADLLRRVKTEGKGGLVIEPFTSPRVVKCGEVCKVVNSMNIWSNQTGWPQPLTKLATLEAIVSALQDTNISKLSEYRRDIQLLSTLGALSDEELRALWGCNDRASSLYQLVRREVSYSYISTLREDRLTNLSRLLGEITGSAERLHHASGEDIGSCLKRLVSAKTLLDLVLIRLRHGES
ncbi:MAG: hypothetical protein QXI20_10615 [Candidatus Jordarchaeales archaeon]